MNSKTYRPSRIRADHAAALDRIGAGMVAAAAELELAVAPVVSRQSLVDAAVGAWIDQYERRQEKTELNQTGEAQNASGN